MSRTPTRGLFAQVETYFTDYLPKQRGASVHTVRAYRDALTLLIKFVAEQLGRGVATLQLSDLDADAVMRFLDHIELERANTAATRNCRRAAIRGFFKHLLRSDLTHSQQYMRVLAIPAKKARQRKRSANPSTHAIRKLRTLRPLRWAARRGGHGRPRSSSSGPGMKRATE